MILNKDVADDKKPKAVSPTTTPQASPRSEFLEFLEDLRMEQNELH